MKVSEKKKREKTGLLFFLIMRIIILVNVQRLRGRWD